MMSYRSRHQVHTGPIGNPVEERYIHELAQADEDRGLREAEAYGDNPVPRISVSPAGPLPPVEVTYWPRDVGETRQTR